MIFKFGKYKSWFGSYQLADLLQHVGVHEDKCHQIGERLSNTWVQDFFQWIHSKKKQKIVVKIEPHDIWSMDYTLAQIIHPMLILLKEQKHGTPLVNNCDIPEHLQKIDVDEFGIAYEIDATWNEEGWQWIMDEMIWAFERIKLDDIDDICHPNGNYDYDLMVELHNRVNNGTRLFGTYFSALWD